MAFGWVLLTVALVAGAYLAYRYLVEADGERFDLAAPLVILGLTYLAGWVVSLISIRRFHNLVMPLVVRVYTFGVLAGILLVYLRVIYKIFTFPADGQNGHLPGNGNLLVLFAGFLLLVTLSLLVEKLYLKPHAIALLIAAAFHLVVAVYHHVFLERQQPVLVSFDVYYLVFILLMAFLVSRRYRLARQLIGQLVRTRQPI